MAWERRKRGGLYYTRSHRVDGQVVRKYVGTGALAELAAAQDAAERADRAAAAAALRAERAGVAPAEAALKDFERAAEALMRAALAAAGYRQHHRGEWRRTRRGADQAEQAGRAA